MTGRADIFADDFDVADFAPKKREPGPTPEAVRKVAENSSFKSREPSAPEPKAERAERRIYRTGRNAQFSCKVTQEVEAEIYSLTDELTRQMSEQVPGARWTVGMTVERMVAALRRELAAGRQEKG